MSEEHSGPRWQSVLRKSTQSSNLGRDTEHPKDNVKCQKHNRGVRSIVVRIESDFELFFHGFLSNSCSVFWFSTVDCFEAAAINVCFSIHIHSEGGGWTGVEDERYGNVVSTTTGRVATILPIMRVRKI